MALANILSVIGTVDGSYTVFVPTDSAFDEGVVGAIFKLTDSDLKRIVMFHFYEGVSLSYEELVCGEKISSMTEQHSMSRTKCEKADGDGGAITKFQSGTGNTKVGGQMVPKIMTQEHNTCNTIMLHSIDQIMLPVSYKEFQLIRNLRVRK